MITDQALFSVQSVLNLHSPKKASNFIALVLWRILYYKISDFRWHWGRGLSGNTVKNWKDHEKMLITKMFSFSHNLFNSKTTAITINHFQKKALVFTSLQYKSFENTVRKGEIARNEQFLLFPQCFLSVWITFCHFHQMWNCRLQTFLVWKSLKFDVWESVKQHFTVSSATGFILSQYDVLSFGKQVI